MIPMGEREDCVDMEEIFRKRTVSGKRLRGTTTKSGVRSLRDVFDPNNKVHQSKSVHGRRCTRRRWAKGEEPLAAGARIACPIWEADQNHQAP